jgi:hypothetical protein
MPVVVAVAMMSVLTIPMMMLVPSMFLLLMLLVLPSIPILPIRVSVVRIGRRCRHLPGNRIILGISVGR